MSSDSSWLVDVLRQVFELPSWRSPLSGFVDAECVAFDDLTDEHPAALASVHLRFRDLVETLLTRHLASVGLSGEDFAVLAASAPPASELRAIIDEQILAVDDFVMFKRIMVSRNSALNLAAAAALARAGPMVRIPHTHSVRTGGVSSSWEGVGSDDRIRARDRDRDRDDSLLAAALAASLADMRDATRAEADGRAQILALEAQVKAEVATQVALAMNSHFQVAEARELMARLAGDMTAAAGATEAVKAEEAKAAAESKRELAAAAAAAVEEARSTSAQAHAQAAAAAAAAAAAEAEATKVAAAGATAAADARAWAAAAEAKALADLEVLEASPPPPHPPSTLQPSCGITSTMTNLSNAANVPPLIGGMVLLDGVVTKLRVISPCIVDDSTYRLGDVQSPILPIPNNRITPKIIPSHETSSLPSSSLPSSSLPSPLPSPPIFATSAASNARSSSLSSTTSTAHTISSSTSLAGAPTLLPPLRRPAHSSSADGFASNLFDSAIREDRETGGGHVARRAAAQGGTYEFDLGEGGEGDGENEVAERAIHLRAMRDAIILKKKSEAAAAAVASPPRASLADAARASAAVAAVVADAKGRDAAAAALALKRSIFEKVKAAGLMTGGGGA